MRTGRRARLAELGIDAAALARAVGESVPTVERWLSGGRVPAESAEALDPLDDPARSAPILRRAKERAANRERVERSRTEAERMRQLDAAGIARPNI